LSARALRDVASRTNLELAGDETVGCGDGGALLAEGNSVACVPERGACGRGQVWEGGCVAAVTCPPGSLPSERACVAFIDGSDRGTPIVDIGAWTRLELGPDGGDGAKALCAPLAQRPWRFLASEGAAPRELWVVVEIIVPDNDVTRVHARVAARLGNAGLADDMVGQLVERTVEPLVEVLRSVGGVANAAGAQTTVRCSLPLSRDPVATRPVDGGAAAPSEAAD
jgi:hypothetical protein